jgi:hypothetical protein
MTPVERQNRGGGVSAWRVLRDGRVEYVAAPNAHAARCAAAAGGAYISVSGALTMTYEAERIVGEAFDEARRWSRMTRGASLMRKP